MSEKKDASCVFRVVVAGVIVKKGKVLLLQRRKDEEVFPRMWELPSGKREFGENSTEAVIREVKEETNLSVIVGSPISVFEYVVKTPKEIRDTTQINFLAFLRGQNQTVRINHAEHQTARWFTRDELISLGNISKETRKCILATLKSHE